MNRTGSNRTAVLALALSTLASGCVSAGGTTSASGATTAAPDPARAPAVTPPRAHSYPAYIASGFAALQDVNALPFVPDAGRAAYRDFLASATPRAFAISEHGHWFAASGLRPQDASLPRDVAERALAGCARAAGAPCKLYAVNGLVVYQP